MASAASPAVAQFLTHAAGSRPVEDVVAAKPASNALAASVLPLVLAGILTGALAAHLTRRRGRRAGLVLGGALLTGLAATLIVQTWLGVVGGDWFANAGALSLTVLAIGPAAPAGRRREPAALHRLLRRRRRRRTLAVLVAWTLAGLASLAVARTRVAR